MLEDMKRQKQRPQLPPNPQIADAAHLQNKMSGILEKADMSETEKAQKYGETLFKLQNSLQKAHSKPLQITQPKTENPEQPIALHDRILQSVPKTMQRKAELLLNMIKDNDNITWNEHGVVSYKGKRIAGSNIIDLINDSLRQRKGIEPRGWETFTKALYESNVPQEVVGNQARWRWMQKHTIDDTGSESEYSTPKKATPAQKVRKIPTPYMRPQEKERLKQFYEKELSTPIKKEPGSMKAQSWETWG